MPDFAIRAADAPGDTRAIFEMLLAMLEEAPMRALDPWLALGEIGRVCAEEAAWIVLDGAAIVASLGLVSAQEWYTRDPVLVTRWLYARPAYRASSAAWALMEAEARALVDATGLTAILDVFNPARPGKRMTAAAHRFRLEPAGARLTLAPTKEAA